MAGHFRAAFQNRKADGAILHMMAPSLEFHHVGIACRSIQREVGSYLRLGFHQEGETFEDSIQKVRGLFLSQGPYRVELLEPLTSDSPLEDWIRRGIKIYHQGFLCRDFESEIARLVEEGGKLVVDPVPAIAFANARIAFILLRNMSLIELIEMKKGGGSE